VDIPSVGRYSALPLDAAQCSDVNECVDWNTALGRKLQIPKPCPSKPSICPRNKFCVDSSCRNTPGSFTCECNPSYYTTAGKKYNTIIHTDPYPTAMCQRTDCSLIMMDSSLWRRRMCGFSTPTEEAHLVANSDYWCFGRDCISSSTCRGGSLRCQWPKKTDGMIVCFTSRYADYGSRSQCNGGGTYSSCSSYSSSVAVATSTYNDRTDFGGGGCYYRWSIFDTEHGYITQRRYSLCWASNREWKCTSAVSNSDSTWITVIDGGRTNYYQWKIEVTVDWSVTYAPACRIEYVFGNGCRYRGSYATPYSGCNGQSTSPEAYDDTDANSGSCTMQMRIVCRSVRPRCG
jgi:hypothetical protein